MIPEQIQLSIDGLEYNVTPKKVTPKDCWQTPEHILDLVREVLGGRIFTDPCTVESNPTSAVKFYTPQQNGLLHKWEENAFVNPPYSDPSVWLEKISKEIKEGSIKEAIALVPTGCLGTERSGPYAETASALCLWRNRIHFIDPATGKQASQTSFTSAFLYWGGQVSVFKQFFKHYGIVSVIQISFSEKLMLRQKADNAANVLCQKLLSF